MPALFELQCQTDLGTRIRAEYLEMPGLRLTVPQAARLWNVDPDTCLRLLTSLVETGFLYRSGDSYLRTQ
jgi:DNA-binding IclR family transcriptional regulator